MLIASRSNRTSLIALIIALSFIATLIPIAEASFTTLGTMPCCAGKAGHCDSGIAAKKVPPPKSEPMCGLQGAHIESDGITIVAEPSQTESHHSHSQAAEKSSSQPAAGSASLSHVCHMDCGTCATASSRQQKRERSIVLASTYQAVLPATSSQLEDHSFLFSSSDSAARINPRGPPASR